MHRKYIYILTLALSISLLLISAAAPAQTEYSPGVHNLKQQFFTQKPSYAVNQVCAACHNPGDGIATLESPMPVVTQFTTPDDMASRIWNNAALLDTSSPALHADIGLSLEQELALAAFMRSLPGSSHAFAMSFFTPLVNR